MYNSVEKFENFSCFYSVLFNYLITVTNFGSLLISTLIKECFCYFHILLIIYIQ